MNRILNGPVNAPSVNNIVPFYKFRAEAGDEPSSAELLIFDVIGEWNFFGEAISAKQFAADLAALPTSVNRLDIHINSPGGSVPDAMAIYSRLADHRSNKNVYIDGLAASAATLIAMVGHKIFIRANAQMMIHLPMGIGIGNANEMRSLAAALDSNTESMLNLYARSKQPREELRAMMTAETWFDADTAVEKGFADEKRGVVKAAAIVGDKRVMINGAIFDLSHFRNVPAFTGQQQTQTERQNMSEQNQNPTPPTPPAAPPAAPQQPTPPCTAADAATTADAASAACSCDRRVVR
jgi:ATP-dependent Clp protease protease subunit